MRSRVDIPIAAGEKLFTKFPFFQIVAQKAADILQPDIMNAGGITELKKISTIAETNHVLMATHNVCSPVGAMAEIHLGLATVNFFILEYHAEFYSEHYSKVAKGFPRQKDGYVRITDAPGLGLTLDEDEIARHPPLPKVSASRGTIRGI